MTAYWPRSNHGSVLLTAQIALFKHQTTYNIHLEPFEAEEGSSCLLKYLGGQDISGKNDDAVKLCEVLGGLPLAIAHFAGYMTESALSCADALKLLTRRREAMGIFDTKPETTFGYPKSLSYAWDVPLEELDADALKLMQVLSMVSADGVPEEMFLGDHPEPALSFLRQPSQTGYVLCSLSTT